MTPHQTLAVAVRLFAILLALYAVRELLGIYVAGRDWDDAYLVPIVAAVFVLVFALLIVLWFFPRSIARGLLPLSSDTPTEPSTPDAWLAIGSALIGLWLVASAMPAIARNLLVLYIFRSDTTDKTSLTHGLLYYLLQFAVGAALVFGANGVRNLIAWARTVGTPEPSNNVVESDAQQQSRAPHHER